MKKIILTYLAVLLVALPTMGYALTFSEEIPTEEGLVITSIVLDKSANLKNDHYICLGDGWDKTNAAVDTKINNLKASYPNLLKNLGENQKNCFATSEVPDTAQKTIDDILIHIDVNAKDKFYVALAEDGKAHLADHSTKLENQSCLNSELGLQPFKSLNLEIEKFELKNEKASLGKKLTSAQVLIGGTELVGMGILITLPKSITKWEDDWVDDAKRNLKRAWTKPPVWDKDDFFINYIGHPLAGAAYYNMLRSQGGTRLQSFLFSTVQSTIWEYGIEAVAEQPSIQDLFITPVVGSIIGEVAHWGTNKMRQNGFTFGEKVLVTIINPTYVLNNGFRTKNKK